MINNSVKFIISIIGKSNVGKTTLIEKMLPAFSARGYKIGTIKHHYHDYDSDIRGKDSWRHQTAGARQTIISSPNKMTFFSKLDSELSIDELARYFDNSDIIITDGYKKGNKPKIEVFRPSHYGATIAGPEDNLIAYATDSPDYEFKLKAPVLNLNDAESVTEFILRHFKLPQIKNRGEANE
ncbi:MAG TPA: molybdopterin-guanine dinucleotide biosynthesis protein B [Candidatus Wallbacteria bacterium]|nr:molybdopterin-guanine dinucleotide biosynthesis protein B [Candidatus Wallbacteria bacterium]